MRRLLVFVGFLVTVSGCTTAARWSDRLYPDGRADVVLETPHGDVGLALLGTQPELEARFVELVRAGFYTPTDVDRAAPNMFVVAGDGTWEGRRNPCLPAALLPAPGLVRPRWVSSKDGIGREARAMAPVYHKRLARDGELGLLTLGDGSHSPQFVLINRTFWGGLPAPMNTAIARVVYGREFVRDVVRGDKLVLRVAR